MTPLKTLAILSLLTFMLGMVTTKPSELVLTASEQGQGANETGVAVDSNYSELASNPASISLQCSGSTSSKCEGKLCTVLCSDGHKVELHCEDEGINVNSNQVGGLNDMQVSCGKKVQFRSCFPYCQGKQTLDTEEEEEQVETQTGLKHKNAETGKFAYPALNTFASANPFVGSIFSSPNPFVNFNPFSNYNPYANFNKYTNQNPYNNPKPYNNPNPINVVYPFGR